MFVPGKPLQLSLMFASKAGAYLSGAPLHNSTLRVFILLDLPTLIKDELT